MRRALSALIGLAIFSAVSFAQTSSTDTSSTTERLGADLVENTPATNVLAGNVSERAPARLVDQARLRHSILATQRLAAQRERDTSALAPEDAAGGSSSTSGLLDSLLGSGLLGALGGSGLDINSLLGTGTSSSGLPSEVLTLLQSAGIDVNDVLTQKTLNGTTQEAEDKATDRQQTSTTTTQPFRVRWGNAMLSAFFTAVVAGLGTQDFVDVIADLFAPIFQPAASSDDSNNGDDGDTDNGDDNSDDDAGDGDPII